MFRALSFAAATLLLGQGAYASTVTYDNLASYEAALGASAVAETFQGGHLNGTAISDILGSKNFGGGRLQQIAGTASGVQYTTIVFSHQMKGVGFDIGAIGRGELANILLDGVQVATLSHNNFFGISKVGGFKSITFVDATFPNVNTQFNLDNMRVTPVPVVASLPLLLGGFGALFGLGKKRRKAA